MSNRGVISGVVVLGNSSDVFDSHLGTVFGRVYAGDGDDQILGGASNDIFDGGAGADFIDGGAGRDIAIYSSSAAGVAVNLLTGAVSGGDATRDTLISIEDLEGSGWNDSLAGNSGANTLFGLSGNDTLAGGAGADTLDGGFDTDTASYAASTAAVSVSLATGFGSSGDAAGDRLISIENLTGSNYNDFLTGNAGANTLSGGNGNDTLNGGAGADKLYGGSGTDRISYSSAPAGVTVSLANPASNTGEAAGDTFSSIENITGSNFNDSLTGSTGANAISGGNGNDSINGYTGNDAISGGIGNDFITGYAGNDTLTGDAGNDTFFFNSALSASANIDRITDFNVANDTMRLENAIFTALGAATGTLTSAMFWSSTSGTAHDADDRIIYETDTGKLFYDSNGSAAGGSVQFATLSAGLALTNADFLIS